MRFWAAERGSRPRRASRKSGSGATSTPPCATCGDDELRVVVDTNVWVSGLILPDSIPGQILRAIRDRRIEAVASWPLADEIARVLRAPKLRRYGLSERDVTDALGLLAPFLPHVDLAVELRDPHDAPVVAAAVAGEAEAIVTGDHDLLEDAALRRWLADRGIGGVTPAELASALPH